MLSLKTGVDQDLENRSAHPHHEFPEVPPREGIQYILKSTSVINYDA